MIEAMIARAFQGRSLAALACSALAPHLTARRSSVGTLWPFAGEVLFRGYLFLQLYRRAQRCLLSAVVTTALVFGLVHFGNMQAERGPWRLLAEVLITGLGGAFFAWLLVRWDNNLWIPISHACLHESLVGGIRR